MIKFVKNDFFIYCKEARIESHRSFYGSFCLGPFEAGQSITIANALRRTLLSELKGLAITSAEIEGAFHEYATLPGVRDSILDILLNLKDIVLKSINYGNKKSGTSYTATFKNEQRGYLKSRGPGVVTASDLKLPPGIQCVDPDQYIATLSEEGILNIKFNINQGVNGNTDTSISLRSNKKKSTKGANNDKQGHSPYYGFTINQPPSFSTVPKVSKVPKVLVDINTYNSLAINQAPVGLGVSLDKRFITKTLNKLFFSPRSLLGVGAPSSSNFRSSNSETFDAGLSQHKKNLWPWFSRASEQKTIAFLKNSVDNASLSLPLPSTFGGKGRSKKNASHILSYPPYLDGSCVAVEKGQGKEQEISNIKRLWLKKIKAIQSSYVHKINKKKNAFSINKINKTVLKELGNLIKKKNSDLNTKIPYNEAIIALSTPLTIDPVFMPVNKVNYIIEINEQSVISKDSLSNINNSSNNSIKIPYTNLLLLTKQNQESIKQLSIYGKAISKKYYKQIAPLNKDLSPFFSYPKVVRSKIKDTYIKGETKQVPFPKRSKGAWQIEPKALLKKSNLLFFKASFLRTFSTSYAFKLCKLANQIPFWRSKLKIKTGFLKKQPKQKGAYFLLRNNFAKKSTNSIVFFKPFITLRSALWPLSINAAKINYMIALKKVSYFYGAPKSFKQSLKLFNGIEKTLYGTTIATTHLKSIQHPAFSFAANLFRVSLLLKKSSLLLAVRRKQTQGDKGKGRVKKFFSNIAKLFKIKTFLPVRRKQNEELLTLPNNSTKIVPLRKRNKSKFLGPQFFIKGPKKINRHFSRGTLLSNYPHSYAPLSIIQTSLKNNIILEIWTNGSIHPRQALYDACKNLLSIFSKLEKARFTRAIFQSEKTYEQLGLSLSSNLEDLRAQKRDARGPYSLVSKMAEPLKIKQRKEYLRGSINPTPTPTLLATDPIISPSNDFLPFSVINKLNQTTSFRLWEKTYKTFKAPNLSTTPSSYNLIECVRLIKQDPSSLFLSKKKKQKANRQLRQFSRKTEQVYKSTLTPLEKANYPSVFISKNTNEIINKSFSFSSLFSYKNSKYDKKIAFKANYLEKLKSTKIFKNKNSNFSFAPIWGAMFKTNKQFFLTMPKNNQIAFFTTSETKINSKKNKKEFLTVNCPAIQGCYKNGFFLSRLANTRAPASLTLTTSSEIKTLEPLYMRGAKSFSTGEAYKKTFTTTASSSPFNLQSKPIFVNSIIPIKRKERDLKASDASRLGQVGGPLALLRKQREQPQQQRKEKSHLIIYGSAIKKIDVFLKQKQINWNIKMSLTDYNLLKTKPELVDIGKLNISLRPYTCLKRANINTLGELLKKSKAELLALKNFGKQSLKEVEENLKQLGLSLKS